MYIDKLFFFSFEDLKDKTERVPDFWAWQTDRFHGLRFYSVTTASGGCAINPMIRCEWHFGQVQMSVP